MAALETKSIPTILTGFDLPEGNIHSPNERLRVEHIPLGIEAAQELYRSSPSCPSHVRCLAPDASQLGASRGLNRAIDVVFGTKTRPKGHAGAWHRPSPKGAGCDPAAAQHRGNDLHVG